MADHYNRDRREILQDLLREKSLWAVYVRSRSIPFSLLNNAAGVIVAIAIGVASCWSASMANVADHLSALSVLAFNTSISLLGFLLAGFSFFATVSDKSMFCRMAEVQHKESGLSYLKYNFYVFMRVLFESSAVAVVSFLLAVILQPDSGTRIVLTRLLDAMLPPRGGVCMLSGALDFRPVGAFGSCLGVNPGRCPGLSPCGPLARNRIVCGGPGIALCAAGTELHGFGFVFCPKGA